MIEQMQMNYTCHNKMLIFSINQKNVNEDHKEILFYTIILKFKLTDNTKCW